MDSLSGELVGLMGLISKFTEYIATLGIENVQTKRDFSPVTLADFGSQVIVSNWLNINFRGEPLIAEESLKSLPEDNRDNFIEHLIDVLKPFLGELNRQNIMDYLDMNCSFTKEKSYWVLDPLDGTKGFLRGDQYAISLGHVNEGFIDVGILACPRLRLSSFWGMGNRIDKGYTFFAQKRQGAWMQPLDLSEEAIPIHVSECKEPQNAVLLRSYESKHTDLKRTTVFLERMDIKKTIPVDSQVKYGLLACGIGEIILRFPPMDNPDYREKVWDHVGGAIILQEAGGKVTDILGNSFQYDGSSALDKSVGVFASNGYLHKIGLEVLQEVM